MKSLRTMVAGVSMACLAGSMGSCVSSNYLAYKSRYAQQQALANEKEDIIKKYGVSTLQPNGNLSSIEGNDVLYFNSKGDSIVYDRVNRLSNGIIRKAYAEGQITLNSDIKTFMALNSAKESYYNVSREIENPLLNYAYNTYDKGIKKAVKQSEKLRKNGRKNFCAFVRKNAKLIK